jgi:pimeloyl-ACP methyl ester carboxylesterase
MRILQIGRVCILPPDRRRCQPVDSLSTRSSDGTLVGCELLGEGPPLLLVHGSTADRNRWVAVRDALAQSFRLHLMDRRGRGLSSDEAGDAYSLELEADDVRALVAAIGESVLVLAHSYGAACALEAATACDGIERMLVYEPAFGTPEGPVFPDDALVDVEASLAAGDREAALTAFFSRVLLLDDAAVEAMRATPMWQARLAAVHTLAREARAANAYRADPERMRSIGVLVRILLGTETTPALTRAAHVAADAVPGAELVELPGHGHAAMDADPPLFIRQVKDWLG